MCLHKRRRPAICLAVSVYISLLSLLQMISLRELLAGVACATCAHVMLGQLRSLFDRKQRSLFQQMYITYIGFYLL